MATLKEHLQERLASAFRRFQESLHGVNAESAALDANPAWKQYRNGAELDGSIAGIVRHVGLWKHVSAAGLTGPTFPDPASIESPGAWPELQDWLAEGHRRFAQAVAELEECDLERNTVWEGHPLTIATVIAHMIEHDQYHAGQVNLLRQQRGEVLVD